MNVIKLKRTPLLPGLLIKALLHLLPHWISSTQSTLSYLISLRSTLYPPTYVQISQMVSLPWMFPCKISYKLLIFKHYACTHPCIALWQLVKRTYYGPFHYILFSVYFYQMTELYHTFSYIHVTWIIFRRRYINVWILASMSVSFYAYK